MPNFFFDSSALVKRYVTETGTAWVQGITDPVGPHTIYIARITGVEVVAAFHRGARVGSVTAADAARGVTDFIHDFAVLYSVLEIKADIIVDAMRLVGAYPLKAYDAVQLAAALKIEDEIKSLGLPSLPAPSLTMVSADRQLNNAARAEGLTVDNPLDHP